MLLLETGYGMVGRVAYRHRNQYEIGIDAQVGWRSLLVVGGGFGARRDGYLTLQGNQRQQGEACQKSDIAPRSHPCYGEYCTATQKRGEGARSGWVSVRVPTPRLAGEYRGGLVFLYFASLWNSATMEMSGGGSSQVADEPQSQTSVPQQSEQPPTPFFPCSSRRIAASAAGLSTRSPGSPCAGTV